MSSNQMEACLLFVEDGNYEHLCRTLRSSDTHISENAILAVWMNAISDGDMSESTMTEIYQMWKEAGHAANLNPGKLMKQMLTLMRQQKEQDSFVYPEGRQVFVVNTEGVPCMCRGEITYKLGKPPSMGKLFVDIGDDIFSRRILQVKRSNILFQKPKTLSEDSTTSLETIVDGPFTYRLMSL